tara:strand:+ start:2343 stop:2621 length:279 start_codon:yes stop_codon:yes gene_type:complete
MGTVNFGRVLLYTREEPVCNFCIAAKNTLDYYGVEYDNKIIGKDISRVKFMEDFPNIKSVPAVFFGEEYIGGYNELEKRIWELPVGNPATHG